MGLEDLLNRDLIAASQKVKRQKRRAALIGGLVGGSCVAVGELLGYRQAYEEAVHPVFVNDAQLILKGVAKIMLGFLTMHTILWYNLFSPASCKQLFRSFFYYFSGDDGKYREADRKFIQAVNGGDLVECLKDEVRSDFAAGEYDSAVRKGMKLIDIEREYKYKLPDVGAIAGALARVIGPLIRRKDDQEGRVGSLLYHAVEYMRCGARKRSMSLFEKAISREGDHKVEVACLYSHLLTLVGEDERAKEQWGKVVQMLWSNSQFVFQKIGATRNEVLEVTSERFFKDMFVFKKGDGRMVDEYRITGAVYQLVKSATASLADEVRVAQPLGVAEVNGGVYYIVRRRREKSLDEALRSMQDPREKEDAVRRVLESQALMHAIVTMSMVVDDRGGVIKIQDARKPYAPVRLKRYDHEREVQRRFVSRIGENESLGVFWEAYRGLQQRMRGTGRKVTVDSFCHGDAYPENALVDGTLIDFEKATIASPSLDVVCLLDDPCLRGLNTERLAEYHRGRVEEVSDGRLQASALRETWVAERVHNFVCQIGSKLAQGKVERARFFMREVLDILSQEDPGARAGLREYVGKSLYAPLLIE